MKQNLARIIGISLILLSLSIFIAAQNKVVPIVSLSAEESNESRVTDYGNLLGGVENGKWLDAKTTFGKLKGDEKYSLFRFTTGKKGLFSLGEIKDGSGACPENYFVQPELTVSANLAIGTNADWMIVPRQPKSASLTDASYKKAVATVLRLRGLKSPVKIKKAYRIDLDGDGREEVILVAHYFAEDASQNAKVGNYSFVLIQKRASGKTQNLLVGGTFLRKKDDYYEGEYFLSGIADLNGDGKMELLVDVSGYEENWTKVYEMKAGKPAEIKALSYYCGV
jgi:hypothetical protein